MILILGDIFNSSRPSLEIWHRAFRILALPKTDRQSELRLVKTIDKPIDGIPAPALQGVPVIALCGNHEHRSRGLKNPVEILESAGKLIHLEANTVVFDGAKGRVALHGLSYVPEKYLIPQLRTWNPKPLEGAFNILLLHQSIGDFVYSTEERPTLQISDLPPGFDLYLDGHVHYRVETEIGGAPLLFPGSTERTQLLEVEARNPKGFYMIEVGERPSYRFVELRTPRDFFYDEPEVSNASLQDLYTKTRARIRELLLRHRKNPEKLPIVRIRLKGTLAKDVSKADFDEHSIVEEFGDEALVVISKDALVSPGLEEKLGSLKEFREKPMSIDEKGLLLLEEYAKDIPKIGLLNIRDLFELLVEDRTEEALQKLSELAKKLAEMEGKQ
jgi:DNA repair exonuclease SbcCD nuclease subunit